MSASNYFFDTYFPAYPSPKTITSAMLDVSIDEFIKAGGVIREIAPGVMAEGADFNAKPGQAAVDSRTHKMAHEHRPKVKHLSRNVVSKKAKPKPEVDAAEKVRKPARPRGISPAKEVIETPRRAYKKSPAVAEKEAKLLEGIREGVAAGLTTFEISAKCNKHYSTIYKLRRKHGLLEDMPKP